MMQMYITDICVEIQWWWITCIESYKFTESKLISAKIWINRTKSKLAKNK